jgi:hypothetical protein
MDEYELLKKELNELFLVYVEKSRNLQWLESQREIYIREEQEKLEEVNRKMRRLQRRVQNEVNYHLTISLCVTIKCNNHSIICRINSTNFLWCIANNLHFNTLHQLIMLQPCALNLTRVGVMHFARGGSG